MQARSKCPVSPRSCGSGIPEVANDDLIVNGLGGVDDIIVGPGVTTLIGVTANQ